MRVLTLLVLLPIAGVAAFHRPVAHVRSSGARGAASRPRALSSSRARHQPPAMWVTPPTRPATARPARSRRRVHPIRAVLRGLRGALVVVFVNAPVRGAKAVGRAAHDVCLLVRRPWMRDIKEDLKAAQSAAAWAPSAEQVQLREKRITSLVRLDTEGVFSRFYKMLTGDLTQHLTTTDPSKLSDKLSDTGWKMSLEAERSLEARSPLLQWHLKHHSLFEQLSSAAAVRGLVPGQAGKGLPAGKGAELKKALEPIVELNLPLLKEAASRKPAAAPGLYLHAAHCGYLLGLWRSACVLNVPPARRYALMNAFLCKVALTVATCREVIDVDDCGAGTECRLLLDGGCIAPP